MTVRFLLFRGSWENEGNFHILESEQGILVLATGKEHSLTGYQEQQAGRDYLKENRAKIKAIIVANTNWQNIGCLSDVCREIGSQIPIYSSYQSRLVLSYFFPSQLRNRIILIDKNKELKIEDFNLSFIPLSGYLLGNLGLAIHHSENSFYFLEGFIFSGVLNNRMLFPSSFWADFQQFCAQKRKNTYLITNYWGLHWQNKNSLYFASKNFPSQENPLFFIFYDFDWLHIFELLELARSWNKKVKILNPDFVSLINQVLARSSLKQVIEVEEEKNVKTQSVGEKIYLIVDNPEDIEMRVKNSLVNWSSEKKNDFQFVVGIPPVIGGETRLARIIDYLYTQSSKVVNLSKKEYLSLGVSFSDFKILLQLLQPLGIITLQNSYKNKDFLNHFTGKFLNITNGCALDLPTQKISSLRIKKSLVSLEEILVEQRSTLGKSGLLLILLTAEWKDNQLQLKEVKIEPIAISSALNISKLLVKVKNWWPTKLTHDIKKEDNLKIIKKVVERRLSSLVNNYLSSEQDINVGESFILLFTH
jgi:mRNA degradation ribonuclease J1/J2